MGKLKRILCLPLLGTLYLIVSQACTKEMSLSLTTPTDVLGLNVSDTSTLNLSTFLLDPLPSANQGRLLLGELPDKDLGDITSATSFRLSPLDLSSIELPTDAHYDSLSLRLFYDGYYYGDTTETMTVDVYRLQESIEKRKLSGSLEDDELPVFVQSETLYSDQDFNYDPQSLGSLQFYPKPKSLNDTLKIRLDDNLGKTLYNMTLANDNKLVNPDEFEEFLKGLTVIPKKGAQSIIGLKDSIALILYYSYERQTDGRNVRDSMIISIGDKDYQYNHIKVNRASSTTNQLSVSHQEISSEKTNGQTFIQAGTGIVTRVRFPYLRQTLNVGPTAIHKAELIVETDQNYLGYLFPPNYLTLMLANKYGTPISVLQNYGGEEVFGTFQIGDNAGGYARSKYVFDLTKYISDLLKTTDYEKDESIFITIPTTDLLGTYNMLKVSNTDNKPAIKLNVIYTKIQ